jgi:sterol desaturase/sphingolipid hydroxylase (fatty acid hydroxylase superfamily)
LKCFGPYPVPPRKYVLNVVYTILSFFAGAMLAPFIAATVSWVLRNLLHVQGLVDLAQIGVPGLGGALIAILLSMLVNDIFLYWFHRAQHGSVMLWQEHLVHHCDEYMNVTTGPRIHLLDNVIAALLVTLPTSVLFNLPPVEIAAVAWLPYLWGYFTHSNLRVGFGPLWWLLVSPQYHRIHHSAEPAHQNTNFAAWFPIIDIVFGTAYRPRPYEYPRPGVSGVTIESVYDAFLLPFRRWVRMVLPLGRWLACRGTSKIQIR